MTDLLEMVRNRDLKGATEAIILEAFEHGSDIDARDVAQAYVEVAAGEGAYSGLVDDGDTVREYGEGEYSQSAMEIDFTEAEGAARDHLGTREWM